MPNYIVLGAQWGDEGKGKIVDHLAGKMDYVIRFQGGANAGHTVVNGDQSYVLHLIPGGIISGRAVNIIGNGCVVDPLNLVQELDYLQEKNITVDTDRLMISELAHVVTPWHQFRDKLQNQKIGTTGRGIGPAYVDKYDRQGIRLKDLIDGSFVSRFREQADYFSQIAEKIYHTEPPETEYIIDRLNSVAGRIKPFVHDVAPLIYEAARQNKYLLFEGAQGTMLDVDHGTYPFVTSSSTTIGGAITGSGVFVDFQHRIGIVKAYTTRVGEGPFPTELNDETGDFLRAAGNEYGATTGRPRRCGWLDLSAVKRSVMINGFNRISLSKISCLSGLKTIRAAVENDPAGHPVYKDFPGWSERVEGVQNWAELPAAACDYIQFIEDYLQVPIVLVSTGPARNHAIIRKDLF
jgi:adenylosuccinate synthase